MDATEQKKAKRKKYLHQWYMANKHNIVKTPLEKRKEYYQNCRKQWYIDYYLKNKEVLLAKQKVSYRLRKEKKLNQKKAFTHQVIEKARLMLQKDKPCH